MAQETGILRLDDPVGDGTLPTSGSLRIDDLGEDTVVVAASDLNDADVQAAIEALPEIGAGNVTVADDTPDDGFSFQQSIDFAASLGDLPLLDLSASDLEYVRNEQYIQVVPDVLGTGADSIIDDGAQVTYAQDGESAATDAATFPFAPATTNAQVANGVKRAMHDLLAAQSLPNAEGTDIDTAALSPGAGQIWKTEINWIGGNAGTNLPPLTASASTIKQSYASDSVTPAITRARTAEVWDLTYNYDPEGVSSIVLDGNDSTSLLNAVNDTTGADAATAIATALGARGTASSSENGAIQVVIYDPTLLPLSWSGAGTTGGGQTTAGVAQQQTITMPSSPAPDGGTFDAAGATGLAYNASAATVDAALDATTPPWDVTGTAGVSYVLTARDYADNSLISVDGANLTKTVTPTLTKVQDGGAWEYEATWEKLTDGGGGGNKTYRHYFQRWAHV